MRNETVKNIRDYLGMSQKEFAKWLGVSRSVIGMIETNQRNVSPRVQNKIARRFRITNDFLAFVENKKRLSS